MKSKVDKLDVDKLVPVPVDLIKLKDVYNAKIKNIEEKIPDITNLATNTALNATINVIENKIASITNLATTAALTKIPNISDLAKKADYDAKISKMGKKYFTTSDYNKFTSNTLEVKKTQRRSLMNLI